MLEESQQQQRYRGRLRRLLRHAEGEFVAVAGRMGRGIPFNPQRFDQRRRIGRIVERRIPPRRPRRRRRVRRPVRRIDRRRRAVRKERIERIVVAGWIARIGPGLWGVFGLLGGEPRGPGDPLCSNEFGLRPLSDGREKPTPRGWKSPA
jgi:hypothetical protein